MYPRLTEAFSKKGQRKKVVESAVGARVLLVSMYHFHLGGLCSQARSTFGKNGQRIKVVESAVGHESCLSRVSTYIQVEFVDKREVFWQKRSKGKSRGECRKSLSRASVKVPLPSRWTLLASEKCFTRKRSKHKTRQECRRE